MFCWASTLKLLHPELLEAQVVIEESCALATTTTSLLLVCPGQHSYFARRSLCPGHHSYFFSNLVPRTRQLIPTFWSQQTCEAGIADLCFGPFPKGFFQKTHFSYNACSLHWVAHTQECRKKHALRNFQRSGRNSSPTKCWSAKFSRHTCQCEKKNKRA